MSKRIHLFVSGNVQGVFFRSFTRSQASLRDLRGWVRNLPDGRVEIVAEGDSYEIENFLEVIRKGPTESTVENVEAREENPSGKFQDFAIR